MFLRSGNFTMATTTASTTTTTATTATAASMSPPTIKLLHQNPTITPFDGEDITSYSPVQFLQMCDDVIINSHIQSGGDKISFVRSHLVPGSLASDLMSAAAFEPQLLNYDYEQFKINFLKIFGVVQTKDSFDWAFTAANSLTDNFGTLDHKRAQARSAQLVRGVVDSLLASSKVKDSMISVDVFRSMMEFQYYVLLLTPPERRVASTLTHDSDETLLDFSAKVACKLRDSPTPVVASATDKLSPQQPVSVQVPQTSVHYSSRPVCTYCQKQGHAYKQCFIRKRRERSATRNSLSSSQPSATASFPSQEHNFRPPSYASQAHRARSPSRHGRNYNVTLARPPKFCLIHGPSNHSSEECFAIQKLQRQHNVTVSAPQSSAPQSDFYKGNVHLHPK